MTALDEFSRTLGAIEAKIEHVLEWTEKHEERDEGRFQALATRIDRANGYAGKIEAIEFKVAAVEPAAELVGRAKWLLIGFLASVAVTSGAAAAVAPHLIKLLAE